MKEKNGSLLIHPFWQTILSILPASLLIFSMGSISAYTFHMIGRLSCWNEQNKESGGKAKSISQLWKEVIGEKTSWIVTLSCLLTPLAFNLTYSIVLGDTISSLLRTSGVQVSYEVHYFIFNGVVYLTSCI